MRFRIDIEPMGAVRMTQRSKWTSTAAQRYLNYKRYLGLTAKQSVIEPIQSAVSVKLGFIYPIPNSWRGKKRTQAILNEILPSVKPDIDNVIKGVFDALNGIAWKDDNLVVSVEASKRYGEKPGIMVDIEEVSA